MLDVLHHDYITTARAKGLNERKVIYTHALRNALLPLITIIGLSIPGLIGGSVIAETIFAIPGMGKLFFDAVLMRYAIRINGMDCLALTKLDVLDDVEELYVCNAYKDIRTGEVYSDLPAKSNFLKYVEPIYEKLETWKDEGKRSTDAREFSDLPQGAINYVRYLERILDIPITIVSVGPGREQTILIEDPIHGPRRVLERV